MTRKRCDICGIFTTNIRKHLARNRCARQHIRKYKKEESNEGNIPNIFYEEDDKR